MIRLLQKLSETSGVSGYEGPVRALIRKEIEEYVDDLSVDAMGNLIAFKKGKGKEPRVMLAAHMDEVGFMVTRIEKNGFVRISTLGGIDRRVIPGKRVLVGKEKIPGVIGFKAPHLVPREARGTVPKIEEFYVDVGASEDKELQGTVNIGDPVVFDTKFKRLGRTVVKGKAFDDRVGCAVLAHLVKNFTPPFPLYAVFTVQEEVGLRGARVVAHRITPDIAIVLEGTGAGDFYIKKDVGKYPVLGGGPAITVMDRSCICDPVLVKFLIDTAKKQGIPYQFKRPGVGGTDAGRIHLAREGIRSAVISVPCRYIHSPVGVASVSDIEGVYQLVVSALQNLKGGLE